MGPSGDILGDRVAKGERAGKKFGERAEPSSISWETGERGCVETEWACLGGREVRRGGTWIPTD